MDVSRGILLKNPGIFSPVVMRLSGSPGCPAMPHVFWAFRPPAGPDLPAGTRAANLRSPPARGAFPGPADADLCQREPRTPMKRTAFFVSDGTGITAETLGHSMLSQFGDVQFEQVTLPYVNSREATEQAVARINEAARQDSAKPIVFSTLVNEEHRAILAG